MILVIRKLIFGICCRSACAFMHSDQLIGVFVVCCLNSFYTPNFKTLVVICEAVHAGLVVNPINSFSPDKVQCVLLLFSGTPKAASLTGPS